jgi:ribose/xylose/arabinose/galactoside ABC-type transport system permease subunit
MTDTSAPSPAPSLAQPRRLPRLQELGLIVVILCISLFLWLASGTAPVKDPQNNTLTRADGTEMVENKFLRLKNLVPSVFTVMSWMAIMAIGETVVVISGGIDISVGSIMGLSAFLTALVLRGPAPPHGQPWAGFDWLAHVPASLHPLLLTPLAGALIGVLVAVGIGLLCGLINGLLVVGLRMHPFIVTLATLAIFRWVPLRIGVNLGNKMSMPGDGLLAPGFTDHFVSVNTTLYSHGERVVQTYQFVPMLTMLLCLGLGWMYLRHTVWGRQTYAVGGNEEAARYSGISVAWVKMRVYLISGMCAGIAGMLACGFYKAAQTSTGEGNELDVVAAAVVGGAMLTGGRGTALGAVLGTLFITLIADGISVLGHLNLGFTSIEVTTLDTKLIYGLAIVVAVALDTLTTRLLGRRSARAGAKSV